MGRSREGARIEIETSAKYPKAPYVAPARERGLKYRRMSDQRAKAGRSREGARIEIEIERLPINRLLQSLPRGSED